MNVSADVDTYLDAVIFKLSQYFGTRIGVCDIHPGKLDETEVGNLHAHTPAIYTAILDVPKVELVESGQAELSIKLVSFILVHGLSVKMRESTARNIAIEMIPLLNAQRWQLGFVQPAEEVDAFDLYGLLQSPDKVVGDQGWNPSLQARARDLLGDIAANGHPKIAIWGVRWQQRLRLGDVVH